MFFLSFPEDVLYRGPKADWSIRMVRDNIDKHWEEEHDFTIED